VVNEVFGSGPGRAFVCGNYGTGLFSDLAAQGKKQRECEADHLRMAFFALTKRVRAASQNQEAPVSVVLDPVAVAEIPVQKKERSEFAAMALFSLISLVLALAGALTIGGGMDLSLGLF
jgi:hypothetical protein